MQSTLPISTTVCVCEREMLTCSEPSRNGYFGSQLHSVSFSAFRYEYNKWHLFSRNVQLQTANLRKQSFLFFRAVIALDASSTRMALITKERRKRERENSVTVTVSCDIRTSRSDGECFKVSVLKLHFALVYEVTHFSATGMMIQSWHWRGLESKICVSKGNGKERGVLKLQILKEMRCMMRCCLPVDEGYLAHHWVNFP